MLDRAMKMNAYMTIERAEADLTWCDHGLALVGALLSIMFQTRDTVCIPVHWAIYDEVRLVMWWGAA